MSIRFRLLLSNLAMILVPIFFVVLSALLMALLFRGDIKELRNIYLPPEHYHHISEKDQLYIDLHKETLKNPEQFLNPTYLKEIDGQLNKAGNTSLVVRKGQNIVYLPAKLQGLDKEELPPFGLFGEVDPVEQINHQFISIKKLDFFFPDGSEGSLFFVTDASSFAKFVRSSFPILFIVLLLILIVTNGLLTYYVSRSIILPIRRLQKAAEQIKEGNLNQPIPVKSKDEIGQLAQGFEEMRVRLKESIEKQLAYEENRKELIANISHDLKTPITTIKGYVEGIRDGVANSPEKIDRYIQTIHSKSIDLDHMIDELFLYSKLDLQRLPFHFENIQFDHYLQDFVEELRFDLEEKKVGISLNIEKNGDYLIVADREHLKRVITNIVDNSLKYIDKPAKELSFHLSTIDSYVLFKMNDNGPGIEEEKLPMIFDRFYRVDMARGTEKGGSGLGLSIAKRIIEEHHGSIWAESQKGQGTTILFTLRKAGEDN
ncbi:HAMP domain-containing sensor histidine kinase [Neobacillus novalis]|uniref:histidine kinase n=1 Tax=Neobacillus novalis TaxID=220687 RepID=A0AA95MTP5_9BACI|nr:HAMP domain-containing sensor histidine kinase [Neobacillus novalis]WHY88344.1 HAMP domain-containing sensor histidine kinase [Neobacillus novalis]